MFISMKNALETLHNEMRIVNGFDVIETIFFRFERTFWV